MQGLGTTVIPGFDKSAGIGSALGRVWAGLKHGGSVSMDALGAAFVPVAAVQGASDIYNGRYGEGLFNIATSLPLAGSLSRTLKRTGGLIHRDDAGTVKGLAKYLNPQAQARAASVSGAINRAGGAAENLDKWGEGHKYLKYVWGPWSGMAIGMGTPLAYQAVTGKPFYSDDSIGAYPRGIYESYRNNDGGFEDEYRDDGYPMPA